MGERGSVAPDSGGKVDLLSRYLDQVQKVIERGRQGEWRHDYDHFENSAYVYNALGCMTRIAQLLVHALFALNRLYFVSDRYTNRILGQFSVQPRDFIPRLAGVLSHPSGDAAELRRSSGLLGSSPTVHMCPAFDPEVIFPTPGVGRVPGRRPQPSKLIDLHVVSGSCTPGALCRQLGRNRQPTQHDGKPAPIPRFRRRRRETPRGVSGPRP